ncbi:MAG TPA: ATP-binding protein [Bacillota bacterium]
MPGSPRRRPFERVRLVVSFAPALLLAGAVLALAQPPTAGVPWLSLAGVALVVASGVLWVYTIVFVHRLTGSIEWLEAHLQGLRLNATAVEGSVAIPDPPEVHGLVATVRALTERLQRLARSEAAERRLLETILDAIPSAVVVVGRDRRIRLLNERARRLLGVRRADVPFETYLRDIQLVRALDAALHDGQANSFEIAWREREGELRELAGVVLPLPPPAGGIPQAGGGGAVITLQDISHLRRLERARRDLIANVSHELKTPVAIIRGFAETLREGALERPEGKRFLQRIEEESERVGLLVDRLLLLARLEQPEFKPRMEDVDAVALLEEVVSARVPLAAPRGIKLHWRRPPAPLRAYIDPELVRQALGNLLDNALRYTPDGGEVEAAVDADTQGDAIVFSVRDTGPGIPSEHQERVFERFYRVEPDRARQSGGTGLGLAIVKHVAQVHGGRATVESRPGRGATFRIYLPRHPLGRSRHREPSPADAHRDVNR